MANFVYLIGLISSTAFCYLLYSSYRVKKQLFPAFVQFSKTKFGKAVLYLEWFVCLYALSDLGVLILFGSIRPFEAERIKEKLWYAITDTCIAFAVFSSDLASGFFLSLSSLLFVKYFHFIFEVRTNSIDRDPFISKKSLVRAIAFFVIFSYIDISYARDVYHGHTSDQSLRFLLVNEYLILCMSICYFMGKFIILYLDFRMNYTLQEKGSILACLLIVKNFVETLLYLVFLTLTIYYQGILPLLFIRPFLSTVFNFIQSVKAQVNCGRVVSYINSTCPDTTAEELQNSHDSTCVVCREEMTSAKKLPCGHMFHPHCLKSWFQRQQTCPTCRLNILNVMKGPGNSHEEASSNAPQNGRVVESVNEKQDKNQMDPTSVDSSGNETITCECSTCHLIRNISINGTIIPQDPDTFIEIPSAESLQGTDERTARLKLINNIKVNLSVATMQLNYLEEMFTRESG